MNEDTFTAFSFKTCNGFKTPAQVVAIAPANTLAPNVSVLSQIFQNASVTCVLAKNLTGKTLVQVPWFYLFSFQIKLSNDKFMFLMLSDKRSRFVTHYVAIIVLLPKEVFYATAMALTWGEWYSLLNLWSRLDQAKLEINFLHHTVEKKHGAAATDTMTGLFKRRYEIPLFINDVVFSLAAIWWTGHFRKWVLRWRKLKSQLAILIAKLAARPPSRKLQLSRCTNRWMMSSHQGYQVKSLLCFACGGQQ